jgi:hypothetical protein
VVGSSQSTQPPLYYDDTITASIARAQETEMHFEPTDCQSSSGRTGSSASTFRDTQIDALQSNALMHVQNLSSIVNNPKKKGYLQQAKDLYLQQTGKKASFRVLTEDTVEDSTMIPKVNPAKDFKQYFRALAESNISEYIQNHPARPQIEDPFC